jgi:hypothetical protein
MELETLKVCICDVVEVREGAHEQSHVIGETRSPYFQPEFRFTIDKDVEWAPARSRAPSITIEFDIFEGGY